ncbi:hypothetical protein FAF44_33690 [Nonomuraea sp. MG754425]|uniref:hypothetical protein n=1 Tax=Nonomuraea sp. MG754425 TaxID=2570319 RepID=UPI001F2C564D|nr:hypothetical protein [Nonomuraea sp. MG754425]MCF6473300.1 hypothetical protein [Nonomuraea sp. MG754425]
MDGLARIPLDGGGTILFESVPPPGDGPVKAGRVTDTVRELPQTLRATAYISGAEPDAAWRQDRRQSVVFSLMFGASFGLVNAAGARAGDYTTGLGVLLIFLSIGLAFGLGAFVAVSDVALASLTFLQLRLRGHFPVRGMRFLKDAHGRGILRAEGPRYQFRHALLQDKLSSEPTRES